MGIVPNPRNLSICRCFSKIEQECTMILLKAFIERNVSLNIMMHAALFLVQIVWVSMEIEKVITIKLRSGLGLDKNGPSKSHKR